ncbi:hypothetical protein GLAREA_05706 [Glarea lozoyensis ATCC 20868]|uniref:Uncharacterized protein n=1 Tax=Glarea lozoyensis (strain ATCC 20868 / MF5171) TaxID=1116229 RepID=S3EDL3_GLAL2|nr:uncharacterized protein GLAREA_05706 [Glarea lozoyensis ATCC 20868]EPE36368.1 hypothetical protein GLAREA_05706 [Glarea lozoyensis ATCC 20868]
MLSVYQPPPSEGSSLSKKKAPPGVPYLTKVNGKLVMARAKPKYTPPKAISLLGEAFGVTAARKRAKSISVTPPEPLMIGGIPYVPGPPPPHSAPIPQQPFPPQPYPYAQGQNLQPIYPPASTPVPCCTYQRPVTYSDLPNVPPLTPDGIARLQAIDGHFHQFVAPTLAKETSNLSEESAKTTGSKTTITITKHICANCQRIRSRRYQQKNPIIPGKEPAPDTCRRCQRDVSCSESSDSEAELERKTSRSKRKSKDKRRKKSKKREPSSSRKEKSRSSVRIRRFSYSRERSAYIPDDDGFTIFSDEERDRGRRRSNPQSQYSSEDDIATDIEGHYAEENERGRRGIPIRRSRSDRIRSEIGMPSPNKSYVKLRPTSTFRYADQYDDTCATRCSQTSSPGPSYRYVPAPYDYERPSSPLERVKSRSENDHMMGSYTQPRRFGEGFDYNNSQPGTNKVPVYFNDDDDNDYFDNTFSGQSQESAPDHSADWYYKDPADETLNLVGSWGATKATDLDQRCPRESNVDDTSSISLRSQESRRRRRRERRMSANHWGLPHVLNPKNDDQVIVVKEEYVYRPKKRAEEEKLQEYTDRAVLGDRYERREFEKRDDAERYYRDDWARERSLSQPRYETARKGYRKDSFVDPSLADTDVTYRTDRDILPPAPTPPAPSRASRRRKDSRSRSEYTVGSESQFTADSQPYANGTSERQRMPSPTDSRRREPVSTRNSSQEYRESRNDADRGRPRNSPERYEVREQSTDKHVTFRDSISERSPVKEWSENSREGVR